jgi:hypothetical protein
LSSYGKHGQFMIRQVFEYYLTVGWDWSNQTKTPADAKAKLLADLAAGKVFTRPNGTAGAQAQPQTQAPTQGGVRGSAGRGQGADLARAGSDAGALRRGLGNRPGAEGEVIVTPRAFARCGHVVVE